MPCDVASWRGWEPPPQSLRDSSPSGGAVGSGCSGAASRGLSSALELGDDLVDEALAGFGVGIGGIEGGAAEDEAVDA